MKSNQYGGLPGESPRELARAYIPAQRFTDTFPLSKALNKGTLFPELWRPYQRKRGR